MSKFTEVIKKFSKTFWVANIIELFERWAWYGFYNALALYLTTHLGFSQAEKGIIMGTGSMLLYFLPVITGAVADKVGFKKILILSFTMYVTGYFMMAYFESFGAIFFAFIYVAVAGALFKPLIQGTIAKTTNKETSSIGFGIFYMMVNIGGFIGPFLGGVLMDLDWNYVFAMSMITISVNYFLVFFFYKEPITEKNKESIGQIVIQVFKNIGLALADLKFVLFLIIMVGFWTAFNQLYYSFPVFMDHWADTKMIYDSLHSIMPGFAEAIGTKDGTISSVTMTSLDAFFIIIFQILVSSFVMRFKPLNAIMGGIIVLSIGLGVMFVTQNGWFLILGMLIFSLGEMGSSPKFSEYVGRIAPSDKIGLYMGTSFLPIAAGHQLAGVLSGGIFERIADKYYLAGVELALKGFEVPEITKNFTQDMFFEQACTKLGMTANELTDFLWNTYNPTNILYIYSGIALGTVVLLFLYDKLLLKSKNEYKNNAT